jgi:hypothetical protein
VDLYAYLAFAIPVVLALLAINFELIKESQYRKDKTKKEEREAILGMIDSVRGIGVDPEVNDYIKKLKQRIKEG